MVYLTFAKLSGSGIDHFVALPQVPMRHSTDHDSAWRPILSILSHMPYGLYRSVAVACQVVLAFEC